MSDASSFSPDHLAARARFRSSSLALGCDLLEYPVGQVDPEGEALTIDAARLGPSEPERVVVVSSGLHGVEAYLGSAIQAALLEDHLGGWAPPPGGALVLLHALDPWGFAWSRRVNEDNADLARSFLLRGEVYEGSPEGYEALDALLNPRSPPPPVDPFLALALARVARHGMASLERAVASGQYDHPQGLFYGGAGPSRTQEILADHLPELVGRPGRVLHLDLHTGLAPWGAHRLLVDDAPGDDAFAWLAERFDRAPLESRAVEEGPGFPVGGSLGPWCRQQLPDTAYDVVTVEFGTYHVLRLLAALRAENRAHHWGDPEAPSTLRSKARLRDAFAPADRAWRDRCVADGLALVHRALEVTL